jgi:hypothetical protein
MMRYGVLAAMALACLGVCSVVQGTEPAQGGWFHWWPYPCNWTKPLCPTCPNDYVRKPFPCTEPVKCAGPNDYHRKPMPCTEPVKCLGVDDYHRKPWPTPPALCPPPWYICAPGGKCAPGAAGCVKDEK